MSTVPEPGGAVAVIDVALFTVKSAAGAGPKFTAVAPVKLVPVIVTGVAPAAGPEAGETAVTAGAAAWYVNVSAGEVRLVSSSPSENTVISTAPAAWAGAVTVILVSLTIVGLVTTVP